MSNDLVKVLLVEDNSDYAWMLRLVLTQIYPEQFELAQVEELQEASRLLEVQRFDVILLDLSLPDSSGYETFAKVRIIAPDVPIVVMTALDDKDMALKAVRDGAQDFLVKGDMDIIHLVRSIQYAVERQRSMEDLRRLSLLDELTGLLNRRGFLALAEQHIKIAHRGQRQLILFFTDLDGMKQINDQFGHLEGDHALKQIAAVLRETFRSSDLVARLGGDEFGILAVDAPDCTVDPILARLQHKLDKRNTSSTTYQLALSVGAAIFDPQETPDLNHLLAKADQAVYEIKQAKHTAPQV